MRFRFWRKKKDEVDTSRLLDEKADIMVLWVQPSSCQLIGEVEEHGGSLKWIWDDKHYECIITTGAYRMGHDLIYFVRGNSPHTYNPYLQSTFDPETIDFAKEIAEGYFLSKGIEITEQFKQEGYKEDGGWITSGLMGTLGRDESDRDFFNAIRESKLLLVMKMAAGVAIWEMVQQLITLIGENF